MAEKNSDLRKQVRLYADDRTDEGRKAIEKLLGESIRFSTIPTSGRVPTVNFGTVRYEGIDEINLFVEEIKKNYVPTEGLAMYIKGGK